MKSILKLFFIVQMSLLAKDLNFAFIGLEDDIWKIAVCKNSECKNITTKLEPKTFDHDFNTSKTIYVAIDGSVRIINNKIEKIILNHNKHSYTNPIFYKKTNGIILVKLINKNSTNTKIISIDVAQNKINTLIFQHSTSLNPCVVGSDIFYANVSCVQGCGKIIQEIWHKNIKYDTSNQITMLNALSHQPTVSKNKKHIFFSSNKSGNFDIWKLDIKNNVISRYTKSKYTDSYPNAHDGGVVFIRDFENISKIFYSPQKDKLINIFYPNRYKKIRNLKVAQ